jgi:hypothetical protein
MTTSSACGVTEVGTAASARAGAAASRGPASSAPAIAPMPSWSSCRRASNGRPSMVLGCVRISPFM